MFHSDLIATLKNAEKGDLLHVDIDAHVRTVPQHSSNNTITKREFVKIPYSKSDSQDRNGTLIKKSSIGIKSKILLIIPPPVARVKEMDITSMLSSFGMSKTHKNTSNNSFMHGKRTGLKRSSIVPVDTLATQSNKKQVQKNNDDDSGITKLMLGASEMLPNELLRKYKRYDILHQRGAKLFSRVLLNIQSHIRRHVLHKWRTITQYITYISAVRIANLFRGLYYIGMAKKQVAGLKDAFLIDKAVKQKRYRIEERNCVIIQKWIRRYLTKLKFLLLFRRYKARILVSRYLLAPYWAKRLRKRVQRSIHREKNLNRCAMIIQAARRGYVARIQYRQRLTESKPKVVFVYTSENESSSLYFARNGAALRIQTCYRDYCKRAGKSMKKYRMRRPVTSSVDKQLAVCETVSVVQYPAERYVIVVQCLARMYISRQRLFKLKYAYQDRHVRRIQHFWRRTLARMHLHSLIHKRLKLSRMLSKAKSVLKVWFHPVVEAWRCRRKLIIERYRYEQHEVGKILYERTYLYTCIDKLWQGAKQIHNNSLMCEMQKFFTAMSQKAMLDMSKALKIMTQCKALVDKRFNPKFIDLAFTKIKARTEKKLDYAHFLEWLFVLAVYKALGIDASAKNDDFLPSSSQEDLYFCEDITCKVSDSDLVKLREYKYGRLHGKAAIIVYFIDKFLSTNPDYRRISTALGARSNANLSRKYMTSAAEKIIKLISFNMKFRKWNILKFARLKFVKEQQDFVMSRRIQRLYRGYVRRRRTAILAQQVYFKYIDGPSGSHYWYNSRTGNSFWVKPTLLGRLDCGFPVLLPHEDLLFILYCSVCETKTMSCMCDECDELMCDACFHRTHRTGMSKLHECIKIPSCTKCNFQIGTRMCQFCNDAYCDTCYDFEHKKASFRNHRYKWLTDACGVCSKRAAQWSAITSSNDYFEEFLCSVCCKAQYGDDPLVTEGVTKRRFVGHLVSRRRDAKRAAAEEKVRLQAYMEQVQVAKEGDRLLAVCLLQRVIRGYLSRTRNKAFIAERRALLAKKQAVDRAKNTAAYTLRDLVGVAPVLETDTLRERVLKLFPRFDRDVTAECIDCDWETAYEFVARLDEHIEKHGRLQHIQGLLCLIRIQLVALQMHQVKKQLAATLQQIEALRLKLRTCNDRAEKQALKKGIEGATARLEELTRKDQLNGEVDRDLREKYLLYRGPRELYRLVAARRRDGIDMPFTLSMRRGEDAAMASMVPALSSKTRQLQAGDELNINGYIYRVVSCTMASTLHTEADEDVHSTFRVHFDRFWNAADVEVTPKRLVSKVFFIAPSFFAMRLCHESFPTQYVINLTARCLNELAEALLKLSSKFEEDSKFVIRLKASVDHILLARDFTCKYSYTVVDMNPPYSVKNIGRYVYVSTLKGIATAKKIASIFTSLSTPKTPYELWRHRDGQVIIQCTLRKGALKLEVLGEFTMHLDAPCDVCRECIERKFRETLNLTIGDSFVFVYSDETGEKRLPRDYESKTYSKKVIPFVIDSSTLIGTYIATIIADDSEKPKFIPVFEDAEVVMDQEADESAPAVRFQSMSGKEKPIIDDDNRWLFENQTAE